MKLSRKHYFKSEKKALQFILIELDGRQQKKELGIGRIHYIKKNVAEKWKKNIMLMFPEPRSSIDELAIEEINKIYRRMVCD